MMKHTLVPTFVLALALVGFAAVSPASAQTNLNNRTVLTFSQPVEVPGKILPAGTYTFELNDTMANRHIVQIFDEAGTKLVALVLAVPNRRLVVSDKTVVTFNEVAPGQPQTMRAWFYPGQTVGQEMAYPKKRAQELAASANVIVPSVDDSFYTDATAEKMKTAEVVSINPERPAAPAAAVQPPPAPETRAAAPVTPAPRSELPATASPLPMVALVGLGMLGLGLALRGVSARRIAR